MSSTHAGLPTNQKIKITLAVILIFITVIVGTFVYRLGLPRLLTDQQLRSNGVFLFENPRAFKDFSLVDYNKKTFTQAQLKDKWSLVFFGFTYCPDICPTTMALLNQFYQQQKNEQYGDDLQIILVSVDPARDTPEKLFDYVRFFNEDFIGLTGEFLDIHRFATQLNIPFTKVPGGGENYSIDHSGNIAIINAKGHYVGFFKAPLELGKIKASYHTIRATRDY